jgi:DNA-binding transcriptional MocR family regulator
MVSGGQLRSGARLPTVRTTASRLGVSPATVSEAWKRLIDAGLIETRGRAGSFVTLESRSGPTRSRRMGSYSDPFAQALASGSPDPTLMPSIHSAVGKVATDAFAPFYPAEPVHAPLRHRLLRDWPFLPDDLTVMDGALDAIDRALAATTNVGDKVVVEDPNFPPLLDILESRRCELLPVRLDDEGIRVDDLLTALSQEPKALVVQPRAHNPTGTVMSERRAAAIANVLVDLSTVVIEDDHSYGISDAPLASLGAFLPERTIHVRSFSKGYGPDLRLAAVGGPGAVIESMNQRRLLGPGWSSRILQAILLELLEDPIAAEVLESSRRTYARRRSSACDLLRSRGIRVRDGDGLNLWVAVDNEQTGARQPRCEGLRRGRRPTVRDSGLRSPPRTRHHRRMS